MTSGCIVLRSICQRLPSSPVYAGLTPLMRLERDICIATSSGKRNVIFGCQRPGMVIYDSICVSPSGHREATKTAIFCGVMNKIRAIVIFLITFVKKIIILWIIVWKYIAKISTDI